MYGPEIFLEPASGWRDALLHRLYHALVFLGILWPVEDGARCRWCGRRWWGI